MRTTIRGVIFELDVEMKEGNVKENKLHMQIENRNTLCSEMQRECDKNEGLSQFPLKHLIK